MNALPLAILVLATASGCAAAPTGAPTELEGGFRREGSPTFAAPERGAVVTARKRVEQYRRRRIDAYYRVRPTGDGFSVCVLEVHRYVRKQPMFTIGADWFVDLKADGTITEVFHSAK